MSDDGTARKIASDPPSKVAARSAADPLAISIEASRATVWARPTRSSRPCSKLTPCASSAAAPGSPRARSAPASSWKRIPCRNVSPVSSARRTPSRAISIGALDVALAEEGVASRGVGVERGARQVHRSSKSEGFVGERHTIDGVALDPGEAREERQRVGDDLRIALVAAD